MKGGYENKGVHRKDLWILNDVNAVMNIGQADISTNFFFFFLL